MSKKNKSETAPEPKPEGSDMSYHQQDIAHMASMIASGYAARTGTMAMRPADIAKEAVMVAIEVVIQTKKTVTS